MSNWKRYGIDWRESKRLHDLDAPVLWEHRYDDLDGYLEDIIKFASSVLKAIGIDNPTVPLALNDRVKLIDQKRLRELADGHVALRLFENATGLRKMLEEKTLKTPEQFHLALYLMGEIADLLHAGDSVYAQHARTVRDNYDRDEEIRNRRAAGEKVSVLALEFGLSEKQIGRIARQ